MTAYERIDLETQREASHPEKYPFAHQRDAFTAMTSLYTQPMQGYKASILVLPTGAGKTFTAVRWLCEHILASQTKVLWLAQSDFLLDQAAQEFRRQCHLIPPPRKTLNLRVVSSNTTHANAGSIEQSDDILICTTQTAITAYSSISRDMRDDEVRCPFYKWIDGTKETNLFVVLDEAHHAPAYGCRTLLTELRNTIPNLYLLGLTATPTHTDERIRGWLNNIFNLNICYQANEIDLRMQKILARPRYIQRDTKNQVTVDDNLFQRLFRQHKDLPSNIIKQLADNHERNDFIVNDYLNNRVEYGKTIIFADRWYQCEMIRDRLCRRGIRADAVYSHIGGEEDEVDDLHGRRHADDNERILGAFRDNDLDVLINVRMLTEGVDIPDVKTVMITRQTTSPILFTQMKGRALRGEAVGGKKTEANIVLFIDQWSQLLPFVSAFTMPGSAEQDKPILTGYTPIEWISIKLIEKLSESVEFLTFENQPFLYYLPVGWYQCEYAMRGSDSEEILSCKEHVVVYESTIARIDLLIAASVNSLPDDWSAEYLDPALAEKEASSIAERYGIDPNKDNIDKSLLPGLVKILRHIGQNSQAPKYHSFDERTYYDLDAITRRLGKVTFDELDSYVEQEFGKIGTLWRDWYHTADRLYEEVIHAHRRIKNSGTTPTNTQISQVPRQTSPVDLKPAMLKRDNHTCVCCGRHGTGVKLDKDHILPRALDSRLPTLLDDLQTLCKECHRIKDGNIISFRVPETKQRIPNSILVTYPKIVTEDPENTLRRTVNFFYRCGAVSQLYISRHRDGQYYKRWVISLYPGNSPDWLDPHKNELLTYIRQNLGCSWVETIDITN